jgi:hypothetical protein
VSVIITLIRVKITLVCVCKSHSACGNRTLRVLITLKRVLIVLVSVIITLIRVKCVNHTLRVEITLVRAIITFVRVKITLRVRIAPCVY